MRCSMCCALDPEYFDFEVDMCSICSPNLPTDDAAHFRHVRLFTPVRTRSDRIDVAGVIGVVE